MTENSGIVAVYKHKVYGGTITVYADGFISVNLTSEIEDGKKTSATPEKLAAGHGGWERVR